MLQFLLPRTRAIITAVAALAVAAPAACSLVVESRERQCAVDADCAGFENAFCDSQQGICISRDSSGAAACIAPDGCYQCTPESNEQLLTACTDAQCVPYDNSQIEDLLDNDGSLPAVPKVE